MSFPRYSAYKESKNDWVAHVPEHWELMPCRGFVDERTEKNEDAACQSYLSLMANVGIIPYEEKGDIGNKKPEDLSKCKIVCQGDFVINSMNYGIGSYGVSAYEGVCSPVYIVLTPRQDVVEPRFAFRVFEDKSFQAYAQSLGNGILAHRCAIGWDDLKGIVVGIPSAAEQKSILNFLDRETAKIDALIAEQQRLIELLQEKRQAVISHAVTKGLNPNAPMKDSGVEWLGEVPEHWGVKRVKQCIDPARPVTYGILKPGETDESGIPMIRAQDYSSEWKLKEGILMVSAETEAPYIRSRVRAGDVLITAVGAGTGNCAVVPDYLDGSNISRASCRISVDNLKLTSSYLLFVLSSIATKTIIQLSMRGAAQPVLNNSEVENLLIPLPPLEEQNQLVQVLGAQVQRLDKQQGLAFRQVELLQERRSALISAAVTGQIDVRGLEQEVAA